MMVWEWTFIVAVLIGAIVGALVTAVILLDHQPPETKRKWWDG